MKCFRYLLVNALLLCVGQLLVAQGTKSPNAKADKAYEKLGYREAIELYRQGKLTLDAMERMANSYRLNGDTWNAERWYGQIVNLTDNPLNYLYYAQALHSNGNYELAKTFYLKYDQVMGRSNDFRGKRLASALDHLQNFQSKKEVEIRAESAVNSPKLDFSPAFYQNGIVFVSTREPQGQLKKLTRSKDYWTGDDFAALYFSPADEQGRLSKPDIFEKSLSTPFHEGPLSFSRSGDQFFFTRNHVKNGNWNLFRQWSKGRHELKLKIYLAEKTEKGWGNEKLLDFGDKDANDAHPAISPNGLQLYFASDRQGGFGGMDLYVATFSNGEWGTPVNLGPEVNTPGNELFPFIHDDGTLYFASDGWENLGGLDIFYTEKNNEGLWMKPVNLGAPFNSNKDDFGYILDVTATKGYFTSAREGGAGRDDIYSFILPRPVANKKPESRRELRLCATHSATGERLQGVKINVMEQLSEGGYQGYDDDFVVRLVPTDRPDEYAISLKRRDPFSQSTDDTESLVTDAKGNAVTRLNTAKTYLLTARLDGFQEQKITLSGESLLAALTAGEYCIPLAPRNCIVLDGRVLNKRYKNPIAGANVTLMNLCTGDLISVQSDAEGHYDFSCIPCNCDFIIQGAKKNFKQDNNLATTVGLDCDAAKGGRISKDLLLMPEIDRNGKPNVASYDPGRNNKPDYEFERELPIREYYLPDSEDPVNQYLEDPDLVNRILADGLTIELENIYYDFDEYYIRPDAAVELDKVVALMKRYPYLKVQMQSHTDCRASHAYNQVLSENRAKAAVDYIVQRGISRSRITEKGYGESWLTNECEDGVPCTEEEHQMNRRTEIRLYR